MEKQESTGNSFQTPPRVYTAGEELGNSISHGIGAALSLAGLILLVYLASIKGDVWQIVSFSIYGASLLLLYLSSTLYHSHTDPEKKRILKILDHSFIYLLIAGTYTPFLLVSIRGTLAWWLFVIIWVLAVSGIVFKVFFIGRFKRLSLFIYIAMGWLCVVALKQMLEVIPTGGIVWLFAGGIAYTGGTVFYMWKKLPFGHMIWHFFVLGGSVCHFVSIYYYVLPVTQ